MSERATLIMWHGGTLIHAFFEARVPVPEVGDLYWHAESPYRVRAIERDGEVLQIHLDYDHERFDEFYVMLPAGCTITAARGPDGAWLVSVREQRQLAHGSGSDCDATVREAIADALSKLDATPDA